MFTLVFSLKLYILVVSTFTFRMCLVLVVSGIDSYNDTITAAFRALAVKASMMEDRADVRMAYIDEEKQGHFVSALQRTQVDWKYCPSGKEARRVSIAGKCGGMSYYVLQVCTAT